jgi:N-acyl-D-aspartate/D-glutamate deacylase
VSQFDTIIKGGTVVDGTRLPRYRADVGIKDGRVAAIGKLQASDATRVLDADGHIVGPGFIDVHTHFDGQIFWDPYCTTSGWHGVTSVVIGNCGFGFAPVRPDARDRSMLMMSRNEQIPLHTLQAGMPWDWVTFPEYLDSIDRTPKGVNVLAYMPISPLMAWVMGLEEAKSGRPPTESETIEMQRLLDEAMQAGACGWSAQRGGPKSMQADFDGTPFPTDVMGDELCLAFAEVLSKYDYGAIQVTPLIDLTKFTTIEEMLGALGSGQEFSEELAAASGRPVIHNVVVAVPGQPEHHRDQLRRLAEANERGHRVIGQSGGNAFSWTEMTLLDSAMGDASDVWRGVLVGPKEDQLARISSPEVRAAMAADCDTAFRNGSGNFAEHVVTRVGSDPAFSHLVGRKVGEIAAERGQNSVETVLDLSAETAFEIEFESPHHDSVDLDGSAELLRSPYVIPDASDGGAHSKQQVGGKFATTLLTRLVRDEGKVSLEEFHWHASYLSAQVAGLRDRGFIREGAPADIVVYDLENLKIVPEDHYEKSYDFPANEWRRTQRAEGIRYTIVNGEVTFENSVCTGATPGRLVRYGRG